MTRKQITAKIKGNIAKIDQLKLDNLELRRADMLLSDEYQQFTESIERHKKVAYQRTPHEYDGKLIGRVHWVENIVDEDTKKVITIERSQVVRVDGKWIV